MRGKVVLITGACSGIGAETASHFASLGCQLSLTGLSLEGLKETQGACIRAGCTEDQVLLTAADLQDTEVLATIVQKTVDKFGKLDILLNIAGCSKSLYLENTSVEDYDQLMNTNLKAIFFLTQKAMPHLIQSKGSVVSVSSVCGQRSTKEFLAYSMSKAGVDHFTRIVALDVAPKGVRVNAVSPGMIETPIYERSGVPDMFKEVAPIAHPMGRGGRVDEVAKALAFLADNTRSSFITGANLQVDGGFSLLGPI